jgi:hypothetical protein
MDCSLVAAAEVEAAATGNADREARLPALPPPCPSQPALSVSGREDVTTSRQEAKSVSSSAHGEWSPSPPAITPSARPEVVPGGGADLLAGVPNRALDAPPSIFLPPAI